MGIYQVVFSDIKALFWHSYACRSGKGRTRRWINWAILDAAGRSEAGPVSYAETGRFSDFTENHEIPLKILNRKIADPSMMGAVP